MGSSRQLRLLCANIQAGATTRRKLDYLTKGWSLWLPFGKNNNLDVIAEEASRHDLVGLQESDGGSLRSGFVCQAAVVADRSGLPHSSRQINRSVGPMMASGNALIGRFEPTKLESFLLPSRIPGRGVLKAQYALKNGSYLTVVVAHLSLRAPARKLQAERIAQLLEDAEHPILMGDFNCLASAPEMQLLFEKTNLRPPLQTLATYPAWSPSRAIDHIWVGGGIKQGPVETVSIGGSDHLAVSTQLTLPSGIVGS